MKANKATVRARVEDILRVLLDGAQPWQIRQYVAEQEAAGEPPWTVPEGGKPLSERQIRRYCDQADRLIASACRTHRKKLLRRHVARRESLYARAVNKGDERTALAVLRDLGELQGLYGDETTRLLEELRQRVEALQRAHHAHGNGQADGGAPTPTGGGPDGGGTPGRADPPPAAAGPQPDSAGERLSPGPVADEPAPLDLGPHPDA